MSPQQHPFISALSLDRVALQHFSSSSLSLWEESCVLVQSNGFIKHYPAVRAGSISGYRGL